MDVCLSYLRVNGGRALNDDEIGGMLIGALFAGQHTSSVTSSWTGYFLVHHPEWMEKCIEEQREIVAKFGEELTFDALNSMTILHRSVVSLRNLNALHSSVPVLVASVKL